MESIELMLPVGQWESLSAAANAGADSVYFGVQGLNMRSASSVNFTLEDLAQIVAFCKNRNLKSYLTLNTVLYDTDLAYMRRVVDCAK
ncbi:MAG: U32 family peptidase, partial [Mucinivorans sp.]